MNRYKPERECPTIWSVLAPAPTGVGSDRPAAPVAISYSGKTVIGEGCRKATILPPC